MLNKLWYDPPVLWSLYVVVLGFNCKVSSSNWIRVLRLGFVGQTIQHGSRKYVKWNGHSMLYRGIAAWVLLVSPTWKFYDCTHIYMIEWREVIRVPLCKLTNLLSFLLENTNSCNFLQWTDPIIYTSCWATLFDVQHFVGCSKIPNLCRTQSDFS